MNKLLKQLLLVTVLSSAALSAAAAPSHAISPEQVKKSILLKDGSTLHILKDGKMAMENKLGKAVSMKPGDIMETKDGTKIMMHGNELMRLDNYLQEGTRN